jgi:hypothetical protein
MKSLTVTAITPWCWLMQINRTGHEAPHVLAFQQVPQIFRAFSDA